MLTDSPVAVLDHAPDDATERTTQLFLTPWQWPTRDPDETVLGEARRALRQRRTPSLPLLRRVLAGLRTLAARRCGLCHTEPVARPDQPADTVDGRFCADCIERCLADTDRRHWCPVDALGRGAAPRIGSCRTTTLTGAEPDASHRLDNPLGGPGNEQGLRRSSPPDDFSPRKR